MAVEMRDGKKILFTPISAEDLKDIHIGDIVYLTGDITTCRDVAHRRVVEEGREIPVDVRDAAILHAGPIIRPLGDEKYEMVSVGPTTSMRMEKFEYEFVQTTGVRVIVGKGGMKENTERACKDLVRSIVCFQREMPLWQQLRLRRSLRRNGKIWGCQRLCGIAM
jgi:L(+)-tartrate dehydratase beta subunit